MKPSRSWIQLLVALLALPATAAEVRIAVVAGNNIGLDHETPLRWAEEDAARMHQLLLEIGEVQPDRASLLVARDPVALGHELRSLIPLVRDLRTRERVVLIFYFSGHASDEALHMAGDKLDISRLKVFLEDVDADVTVAFVDACQAGALVRSKGLESGPAFQVDLPRSLQTRGRVVIASSGPSEASLESEDLGSSFFTHFLLSGMRGDADEDRSGVVTLDELYGYIYHQTVVSSHASGALTQHPSYDYDLRGSGAVPIAWPGRARARLLLRADSQGHYLILSPYRRRVIAEVSKRPGQQKAIALGAQRYLVLKRARGGSLQAEVNLTWTPELVLDETKLRFVGHAESLAKGATAKMIDRALSAGAAIGTGIVDGNSFLLGATVGYQHGIANAWSLGGRIEYWTGTTRTRSQDVPTHGVAWQLEGCYLLPLHGIQLEFGATLGPAWHWQEVPSRPDRHSLGFQAGGAIGAKGFLMDPLFWAAWLHLGVDVHEEWDGWKAGLWTGFSLSLGWSL